jgi:hypothetical protein
MYIISYHQDKVETLNNVLMLIMSCTLMTLIMSLPSIMS